MKKFKYRLERVLQYRDVVRGEKKRELLLKNTELQQATDRLEELEIMQRENQFEAERPCDVGQYVLRGDYAARLKDQIAWQQVKIVECQTARDKALQEYVEAAKDSRALEIHKEKKRLEYTQLVDHEEAKQLDELSITHPTHEPENI